MALVAFAVFVSLPHSGCGSGNDNGGDHADAIVDRAQRWMDAVEAKSESSSDLVLLHYVGHDAVLASIAPRGQGKMERAEHWAGKARNALNRIIELADPAQFPFSSPHESLRWLAESEGNLSEAIRQEILHIEWMGKAGRPEGCSTLFDLYVEAGKIERAVPVMEAEITKGDASAEDHLKLARVYLEKEDFENARRVSHSGMLLVLREIESYRSENFEKEHGTHLFRVPPERSGEGEPEPLVRRRIVFGDSAEERAQKVQTLAAEGWVDETEEVRQKWANLSVAVARQLHNAYARSMGISVDRLKDATVPDQTEAAEGAAGQGWDEHAPAGSGVIWTCPLHPNVLSQRSGHCAICGGELAPRGAGH